MPGCRLRDRRRFPLRHTHATLAGASLLLASVFAGFALPQDANAENRRDGDVPGGERHGAEEDTGYTGYPVDPGPPHSAYYDPSAQHRTYSPEWTGAFVGGGLLTGAALPRGRTFTDLDNSLSGGVFLNASSVQQLIDVQLTWNHHSTRGALALDDSSIDLQRHSVGASVLVHPFFIVLLFGDRFFYTLAQIHAVAGVTLDTTRFSTDDDTWRHTAPGWHLGAGFDTYLARPRGRSSWWIGPQWRVQRVAGDIEDPRFRRSGLYEHHVWLRLSWRYHGNLLTGMRGPRVP
ncbi:MAG: hypothetical protein EA398_04505 [Deltaproteobacteria bacterium]|nr:MAG: hypothetical protein EA398_04505 [Deltaproteobacteria bacterium]